MLISELIRLLQVIEESAPNQLVRVYQLNNNEVLDIGQIVTTTFVTDDVPTCILAPIPSAPWEAAGYCTQYDDILHYDIKES